MASIGPARRCPRGDLGSFPVPRGVEVGVEGDTVDADAEEDYEET